MASGVTVSDVCKTTYEEIKKDKKHRYVIFFIRDEKQIDVEVIGDRNATYDQFLEDLQKGGTGECRYGLFDFEYTHQCQGTSENYILSTFLGDDDEASRINQMLLELEERAEELDKMRTSTISSISYINDRNRKKNVEEAEKAIMASKKQKLFLMSWCPDTAKVKKKMLYSSSFDALKKSLVGVQKYIQATDLSEASQEAVEEKLRATDRQ
ncbi:hypothetical protein J437_LFUL007354 [Ladona fulva]|uniref:ADF-H domain-containing protein n=1 Tax=Ladona fulva TaxID=123851 RepID=A0A8K0KH88_LADFU|nr:hypothetical protein J437_LFUL007354 [Ladona fulva]